MIEAILPPKVVSADTCAELLDGPLFPEEEVLISRAVAKRRHEFITARVCARQALLRLGRPAAPILPGKRGEPQWPAGVVGSITHCAGFRGAVVAEASDFVAIGIDAEPNESLPDGVLEAVALDSERRHLAALPASDTDICWDRMLFCAKEAVYKCWFPIAKRWLDFTEAAVTFSPTDGTFTATLLVAGPLVNGTSLTGFSGQWRVEAGLILTAIALPTVPNHS